MEVASEIEVSTAEAIEPAIEAGARFLQALFDESDTILFRPIETWVEDGRKRSHVDYGNTCYRKAMPVLVHTALKQLLKLSEQKHLNIFFGVCPRFGGKGRFDLAWQIRTVRALWADIDHVTVDDAGDRVAKAGLPQPSIVVNSGNGVHLYWLLEQPYLIDDASDLPPVQTEWVDGKGGKKKGLKYIQEAGSDERLYLDKQANVPELSPKATHMQDIVAGIAAAIGGDHTHDLARLLRVPGTFNRKDQRNGHPPILCELVECEPGRKYQLSDFAKFADASPQKVERQKIAAVSLPLPKPLTATKRDKLNTLITACAAAPVGERSGADWRLACTAIEKGWPKQEVWQAIANVGKFAEKGEAYFERTWKKAESQTREQIYMKATGGSPKTSKAKTDGQTGDGCDDESLNDPGLVATLANLICEKERFALDEGGKLYRFVGGVYQPRGESFIRARVKKLCIELDQLEEWSSHVANEAVEFIRVDSPLLWQQPPRDVINVKNGLLDLRTKKLSAHSPDHLSTIQLPVAYDPKATSPKIDRFIAQTFPDDATTIAYEIPAWLMTPDTSIQKAVLLIGPGGNGKSRYLRMVEAFLGKNSVSNLSLHRLESDKFACARLYGKLANICPDLPTEHLAGTSIFKAITGGDPITGEYKFRDSFDFIPYSRLVFSANNPPQAHDSSEGFFDRWLVVPFERRFRGEGNEIPSAKLDAMLSEPSEQAGLLNRALEVLERLRTTGRFTTAESLTNAFNDFRAVTDPLSVWLARSTVEGPTHLVTKEALRKAFNGYLDQISRSPMTEQGFGVVFKKLRPELDEKQRTVGGKPKWCYIGIGLKSELSDTADDPADSLACPEPPVDSRASRASRAFASINLSREKKKSESSDEFTGTINKEKRVERVEPVNGECVHEYVDEQVGDRVRTSCSRCGKFLGYRPKSGEDA